jgi:outer membrane protein TolC
MQKLLLTSIIIFLALLNSSIAEPKSLNLEDAIKIGLKNNYATESSRNGMKKADQAVNEALGLALPSVSVSAGYTRNLKLPVFFLPDFQNPNSGKLNPIKIGAENSFQTAVTMSQILFNSAVFKGFGTSKIYSAASKEQFKSTVTKTIVNVKKSFYGVLLAKDYVGVIKQSLKNAEDNLKTVEALFKEGFIPEFDKIRAEVGVQNIQPAVLQAENVYNNALNGLKLQMGMDINEEIEITGELSLPNDIESVNEKEAVEKVTRTNYDLKTFEMQKKVSADIIDIKRSDFYPTIALFGNYSFQGQSNTFDFMTVSSSAVGLNFSLNLFQGFQTSARTQQAKIDYMNVDVQYRQFSEVTKMQVKNAINQMEIANKRIEVQKNSVANAERGYEIALIRYKEGTGSQMEINDSDTALRQARLNQTQAIHDYLSARADFESLMGSVDEKYFDYAK